ncbi:hydrophobic surface binding protein A [Aspergillus neoniger CBS 115656]|uniref:Hydrophobic surface binding protein A n=1 Tax=Aspergillus neoniger (strain CBS 115656) TaxID=1448310 RepID=A0A318YMW6_ASPNB|nr:hydrophobic surface binding protein A [Aspergillus neoniger CBS 115656]PYH35604.1 hydrophobic surface binding protein A [Aspergillus neoniger CBS 115656]
MDAVSIDAATILIDLYGIKIDIAALSAPLDGFDGTLNRAVDVDYAEIYPQDGLSQAINDVDVVASSTFDPASSTRVTNSVTALKPDILANLDRLVDDKPGFTSAGIVSFVKANLQSLQGFTTVVSTEIQTKVITTDKATIASVIVEVDAV